MKKSKIIAGVIVVVAAVLIGRGILAVSREFTTTEKPIPTVRVERGDVQMVVYTAGELRAPHSTPLMAPQVNGTLQIVSMLTTGTPVKAGETVIQFDPSEQEYNLTQAQSQFKQAEQDILKAKDDADVQAAQDETALLTARFDVRRAELDVQKNELLSAIDAQKNNLALQEAKRKLAQLEQDVKSRALSGEAGIKVLVEKRNAASLQIKVANQNIDSMTLKSSMDGLVTVKENRDATGGFFMPGMVVPDYHAGDLVQSGRMVAEVIDMSQMEVVGKVNEADRSNIAPSETAEVLVDAHPRDLLPAKVKDVASQVSRDRWSNNSAGTFQARFVLEKGSPDLRPGISALVKVNGNDLKGVLYLPAQSVFQKDGKQIVYVKNGGDFAPEAVKVKYRTESRAVIEGLPEGTEVAIVDPTLKEKSNAKPTSALATGAMQ